jgi:hypothetical protein
MKLELLQIPGIIQEITIELKVTFENVSRVNGISTPFIAVKGFYHIKLV